MKRFATLAAAVLAFTAAAFGGAGKPEAPEVPYTATRLSDRVLLIECQNVNVTAIAADSGIVVIDTNRSPAAMRQLRRVIEHEFRRMDFAYVINTHGDPDHASGNPVFPSTPLVAHEKQAAYVAHCKAANMRSRLRNPDPEDGRIAGERAITFRDSLDLDLGDLTLELRHFGEAHTTHDVVVYVPGEKLLLTGDLICAPRSPCFSIDAMTDVPRLVSGLDGFLERKAGLETVVPGHGKPLSRSALAEFCATLSEQARPIRVEESAAWALGQAIEKDGLKAALERFAPPAPGAPRTLDWSEEELGTLGVRLMRRGKTAEAVGVLRSAIRALPGSAYLYGCLGDACLEVEDTSGAITAYEASLALVPQNRHAVEMLEILR